jgi:hypothetical protein
MSGILNFSEQMEPFTDIGVVDYELEMVELMEKLK